MKAPSPAMDLAPRPRPRLAFRRPPHEVPGVALDRFAQGTATQDERALVLRHLLAGCPECTCHLGSVWTVSRTAPADAYDGVFERLAQAVAG